MSNLSFPKDMTGYSQRESKPVVPPESTEAVTLDVEPKADDLNFDLMLRHCKVLVDVMIDETSEIYLMKPRKELYDAKIHLAMVRNLLKSVK